MSAALKPLLAKLATGASLAFDEAETFFGACLRGEATDAQIGAAVTAMRLRGESVVELTACATVMRATGRSFDPGCEVLDTCGTGGDGAQTYNISTAAALVSAAAGVKIAKHGGRAVSSRAGSIEVLDALGVRTDGGTEMAQAQLSAAGVCFLSATTYHQAMRNVAPVRAELGFRTLFNLLGPLANPAGAQRQIVGVYAADRVEPLARVLGALGSLRAWVVHGDGLDELTVCGETQVAEWRDGAVRLFTVTPEQAGLPRSDVSALRGGDAAYNATALRGVLAGDRGPYRDIVLLNAAAALVVADHAATLADGVLAAAAAIDTGAARDGLDRLLAVSGNAR